MSAVPVLRWMKDVPDDTLISKMTIPGTHDSYAYQGKWVGGFARCQEWTVQVYHLSYFKSCSELIFTIHISLIFKYSTLKIKFLDKK